VKGIELQDLEFSLNNVNTIKMMGNYMNYKEDSEHLEFMPNTPASDTNISFAENKEQSEKESLSNKMDTEPLYVQKEN
jgi:hypothetical protein